MARRIQSSVTSISWIPQEAIQGRTRLPFDVGVAHYDPPPPDRLEDLEALREDDRFRFANELRAWIEVEDGAVARYGHAGGGHIGATTLQAAGRRLSFPGVLFPVLRPEPEVGQGWVRFVQTAGGRSGAPAPRRVHRPPFVRVEAPVAWTTLALTIHAHGASEWELVGASAFPRHWIYDHDGALVAKSGLIDFETWYRESSADETPWSGHDAPALVAPAVSAAEREVSEAIMDRRPQFRSLRPGQVLVRQGDPGDEVFLLLDGLLAVEVHGEPVGEAGPGAVLGELAVLEGGRRQATLRAVTGCRVAVIRGERIEREQLGAVGRSRPRGRPKDARTWDAVVVGAGPNGLAAAIRMARADLSVLVLEAGETIGGGTRSSELTLPGFVHDVCSAIHPLAAASPYLATLPLADHGLEFVQPDAPLAHPLDDGTAVVLERSVEATADGLAEDGEAWRSLMNPFVPRWSELAEQLLGPPRPPRHPFLMARFGLHAVRPARSVAESLFRGPRARALFAGLAGHSILPLERPLTAAFGLILGACAHAVGWPVAKGGSQRIADAMASYLRTLGGQIETGRLVASFEDLPRARAYLFDVTPAQLLRIAGARLPASYRRRLEAYRHGPGVFKLDLALDGPLPWADPACARAATVHLGPTLEEIAASEADVDRGAHPERPYVLLAQQSLFDDGRAPAGKHTVWAYCHVPHGSAVDMTARIEAQIERFAPGFRDLVLARASMSAGDFERYNPNYVGGDISGGAHAGLQLFARPTLSVVPYATPADGIYLCSSSTPPGAGVHGMCGFHAAEAALRRLGVRASR